MVQATGGSRAGGSAGSARGRRRTGFWVVLVLVLLVVWAAYAGYQLLQARHEAQAGIDKLERLRTTMSPDTLLSGDDLDTLAAARADFDAANGHATNLALAPLRIVPFAGRQLRSVDKLTGAAAEVSDVAIEQIAAAREVVDTTSVERPERVALVARLASIAADAEADLAEIDLGPSDGLLGPLDRARRRFVRELDGLHGTASNISTAGRSIEGLLQGPGRYLVFAANNSEMRIGSGAFLSVGILTTDAGGLDLGEIRSTTNYPLAPDAVPVTGDFADNWGWLQPNAEWRNLGSTPRFDANADLARQMWKSTTGEDVNGVIALDILALRSLLMATGPVEVDGREISADNVVRFLMIDQYQETPTGSQRARREYLSDVARAVVDRIEAGDWDVTSLVTRLSDAVEGRHLMLWSADPAAEAGWAAVNAGGTVDGNSVLLGLHNRGGNKLDQFLAVNAQVDSAPEPNGTRVDIQVRVRNDTPTGLVPYIAGPYEFAEGAAEGKYQGLLVCNLPPWARDVQITGIGPQVASGPDGDSQVVAAYTELDRGQEVTATISFVLPFNAEDLRIEPSARTPGITWHVGDRKWRDDRARLILVNDGHLA
jgi:hypothetical protein